MRIGQIYLVWAWCGPFAAVPRVGGCSVNLTAAPLNRYPGPLTRSHYLMLPDTHLSKEYRPKPA